MVFRAKNVSCNGSGDVFVPHTGKRRCLICGVNIIIHALNPAAAAAVMVVSGKAAAGRDYRDETGVGDDNGGGIRGH